MLQVSIFAARKLKVDFQISILPHRLIGRTPVFGTVCLGSSPSGATKNPKQMFRVFLWFLVRKHHLFGIN